MIVAVLQVEGSSEASCVGQVHQWGARMTWALLADRQQVKCWDDLADSQP